MGESVNPIEELIAKLRLLGQPSDAGDDSQEWTYRKCADLLEAAIRPYRPAQGPPTKPGDYWVKWCYVSAPRMVSLRSDWFSTGPSLLGRIEWHARVMPPFGEAVDGY